MGYRGQCLCGAVKLVITGEALNVVQCWCRQCQISAGGGAAHNAIFEADQVAITGQLATTGWPAASGARPELQFCPQCGTHICGRSPNGHGMIAVRVGVIDPPHDLAPRFVIWTSEAPAWARIDSALPQMPLQPGMEEQPS